MTNQEELEGIIEVKINQLWETSGIDTWKLNEEDKYKRTTQAILSAGYIRKQDIKLDEEKIIEIIEDCDVEAHLNNRLESTPEECAHAIVQAKDEIIKVKEE